jgi:hypothetical protein
MMPYAKLNGAAAGPSAACFSIAGEKDLARHHSTVGVMGLLIPMDELSISVFSIIDGQHEYDPLGLAYGVEDSIRPCSVSPGGGRVVLQLANVGTEIRPLP